MCENILHSVLSMCEPEPTEKCSASHCENTNTVRFAMLTKKTDYEDVQKVEYFTHICKDHLVQCGQEVEEDFESWLSFLEEINDSEDV